MTEARELKVNMKLPKLNTLWVFVQVLCCLLTDCVVKVVFFQFVNDLQLEHHESGVFWIALSGSLDDTQFSFQHAVPQFSISGVLKPYELQPFLHILRVLAQFKIVLFVQPQ